MEGRWNQVQELLDATLEQPREAQRDFVVRECRSDDGLRTEMLSLLSAYQESSRFLETPLLLEDSEAWPLSSLTGSRIGNYRVVSEISSGGMGTVYLAERADGEFEQTVALKLITSPIPTRKLLVHFQAERQILARLQHPHIARLLDGGTTEDGLPYLVMEYVEGESITTYCDRKQLTVPQRLALFLEVCSAVQAAHQALVVHCDLKPANIFVMEAGTPKLLDFGIARAFSKLDLRDLEEPSASSEVQRGNSVLSSLELALTPAYASPEQLRGEPVTTATDIYSLGVLLAVLLTGELPFFAEEERPTGCAVLRAPSQTVAIRKPAVDSHLLARSSTRAELIRLLAGDLDAIVLKALEGAPGPCVVSKMCAK